MKASSLKEMRQKLGASGDQLAYRLGISQSSVVRLEQAEQRGGITLGKLREAAEALGCEVEYKIRLKDTKKKKAQSRTRAKSKAKRAGSFVSEMHRAQEIALAQKLSPSNRLKQAFELSDFYKKLHHV